MPEMSALIVQEPSMLNDSANFCLDEIFQSSHKKQKEGAPMDLMLKQNVFSDDKMNRVESMNQILSRKGSEKMPSG